MFVPFFVNKELIPKVREEIGIPAGYTTEITYAGKYERAGTALLWYITGGEGHSHCYYAVGCLAGPGKTYRCQRLHDREITGEDIAFTYWTGIFVHCVNDPDLKTIRLINKDYSEREIDITEDMLPYVFYTTKDWVDFGCLDKTGQEIDLRG